MGIKDWLSGIFGKGDGIIKNLADTADRFIQTKEEKAEFQLAVMSAEMEMKKLNMEAEEMYNRDRQSARNMNKSDPHTPRILTIIFTGAYFAITVFMITTVMKMFNQDLNDFVVSFISSIFGAFNAIMVQIISYYFGASKSGDDNGAKIAESFKQANKGE